MIFLKKKDRFREGYLWLMSNYLDMGTFRSTEEFLDDNRDYVTSDDRFLEGVYEALTFINRAESKPKQKTRCIDAYVLKLIVKDLSRSKFPWGKINPSIVFEKIDELTRKDGTLSSTDFCAWLSTQKEGYSVYHNYGINWLIVKVTQSAKDYRRG